MKWAAWPRPHWHRLHAVRTGEQLTLGERAADRMKAYIATWTVLSLVLFIIVAWLGVGGFPFGSDAPQFLRLNLALSCFAALQCFVLLIAAKRADQIASEIALHTERNTDTIKELLDQNTALTTEVHRLTGELVPEVEKLAQAVADVDHLLRTDRADHKPPRHHR